MHHTGGPGWRITVDTSPMMTLAVYLRDTAGLHGAGTPAVSTADPAVPRTNPGQLVQSVGGSEALRRQWEYWWSLLARGRPDAVTALTPPAFNEFEQSPALRRLLGAHFGAALSWARERKQEYAQLSAGYEAQGRRGLLADLVEDRQMELGRSPRSFSLTMIELPLSEPRAWYIEPHRLILSQSLLADEEQFRSYVQPIVEFLV